MMFKGHWSDDNDIPSSAPQQLTTMTVNDNDLMTQFDNSLPTLTPLQSAVEALFFWSGSTLNWVLAIQFTEKTTFKLFTAEVYLPLRPENITTPQTETAHNLKRGHF